MFKGKGERFQIANYYLSKRPRSDYWYATYFDPMGRQTRRHTLGTTDFEEAKVRLAEWVVLNGRPQGARRLDEVYLSDLFLRYMKHKEAEVKGPESIRRALARFLEACNDAPLKVADLNLQTQKLLMERMRATRVGPADKQRAMSGGTIQKSFAACKAAINWAWHNGEVEAPIPFIPFQDHAVRDRVLSIEEMAALFDAAEAPHMRMFLLLLIGTIGRPKAVLELTREQCNLQHQFINLNPPGREQTAKRRPIVPMAPFLVPFIDACPLGPLVHYRGAPIKKINSIWRKTRDLACLGEDVVPYTIRHTMLTELEEQGVPDTIISAVAGHNEHAVLRSSTAGGASRTTRRYIHRRLPTLQPAADAIEDVFQRIRGAMKRPLVPGYD